MWPGRELHVDEDKLLGTGSFGMVYKADWHDAGARPKRHCRVTADEIHISEFDSNPLLGTRRCTEAALERFNVSFVFPGMAWPSQSNA